MKSIRNIALSAFLTIGAFSAVMYTSCKKDACKDVVCKNGGTCASGTCTCPTGYEGTNCETLSRDKFVGVYTGNETCTVGTDTYTMTLSSNSDALKLTMTNLYNDNYTATCTMTGKTTFSFSGTSGTTVFQGTGSLSVNTLTVDYTITAASVSNSCKFTGSK